MQLTKQLEKEVRQVYNAYWDSYLKGDMKAMASFLADDFKVIGSSENEVFFNKKEAMAFYKVTAEQIAGKAEMRNRNIKVEPVNDLFLFTEQLDFYILIEAEWTFYSRGRISSFLQKKEEGWKFIHQHGSLPDTRAQEGEQVAIEKISKENLELRDAVKRRTIELEHKNRDLEIESSLERVRTVAMSMMQPADMLEICRIISKQLQILQVKEIRNIQTAVFYESKRMYLNYEYFTNPDKTTITEVDYNLQPDVAAFANQMLKAPDTFFTKTFTGKEVKDWIKYQEKANQFIDPKQYKASSINYYFYSIGPGALGVSTYVALSEEEINLFKRFRNVFELAYRRYTDIEKAQEQAREAKIEASLERVRAQAMGMKKPEDLLNVCETLFKELQTFGVTVLRNAMINIHDDENSSFLNYDYSDEIGKSITPLFYNIHPVIEKQIKQIRSSKDAFSETSFTGKELDEWKEFRRSRGEKDDPRINNISGLYYYFYSIGTGSIGISTFSSIGEENLKVLKRFRNVFDLSYKRYTDIALAEAQAREARIEAALERTRTHSMLMQHSDEITKVSNVFHEQLLLLGIPTEFSYVWLPDEAKQEHQFWATWGEEEKGTTIYKSKAVTYPLDKTEPYTAICFAAWQSDKRFLMEYIAPFEVKDWFSAWEKWMRGAMNLKPELFPEGLYYAEAYMNYGCFGINIRRSLSGDEQQILSRFTIEFERAYTRFLDLQKAEAQAREAQIEAALERIRSRSLGMQKSEELKEVIQVVYEQFIHLNIKIEHTGFVMDYKARDDYDIWIADPLGVPSQIIIPYFDSVYYNRFNEAKEKGENFFATNLTFEEKNRFYQKLFEHIPGLPEQSKEFYFSCPGLAASTVLLENVCLYIENFSGIPYTDEENNTLMRFGKVFQQTYTRFLDLQKAETQAREAKIEVALERVRAKAMAMHSSEDLTEANSAFYRELKSLSVTPRRCGVALIDKESRMAEITTMNTTEQGESINILGHLEMSGHWILDNVFEHWLKQEEYHAVIRGSQITEYYKALNSQVSFPDYSHDEIQYGYYFMFNEGDVYSWTDKELTEEDLKIYRRFTSVISLTYKRYKDLQHAEAQAREAQIEAALEKVRGRAMAMHNSNDLSATASTVFTELRKLGINPKRCGVALFSKDSPKALLYIATTSAESDSLALIGSNDMSTHPCLEMQYESWLKKEIYFPVLSGEELKSYYEVLSSRLSVPSLTDEQFQLVEYGYYLPFSEGSFYAWTEQPYSESEINILNRFKSIIDLTFRRYLDLQKAEAQTREAKIEGALERVRSKAMAMHKTDDLKDAVAIVFEELDKLSLGMLRCGIGIFNKEKRTAEVWTTSVAGEGYVVQVSGDESMDIHPLLRGDFAAWLRQEDFYYVLEDEDMSEYYHAVMGTNFKLPESQLRLEVSGNLKQYYFAAMFESGSMFAFRETDFTEEAKTVMKRFAGVFNLTYKRFIDIQKAEAQTREAKIEAALERVRAKAMAMHKSDDLNDAVAIVFDELDKLSLGMLRCGIGILSGDHRCADVWTTTVGDQGRIVQVSGDESLDIHPLLQGAYDAWVKQGEFSYMLEGEDMSAYYRAVSATNFKLPESQSKIEHAIDLRQYYYACAFQSGNLFAFCETDFSEEAKTVMKRFAGVFNLTYKRFLDIQKAEAQAIEAQLQKQLIETKHREITENISYALRIQNAILPDEKLVKEYLQNSFVLYLPKDVVAGDFYWMLRLENMILFSANDCTGHGVSGAMVSVFCHNALNRAIREYNLTQPSLILDKVAELVEENFTQSEDKIQDGMDTSLCAYFPQQRKLQWAGANNPLWIVRNNELLEYKPDKQPIGKYENRKPYTNHEIELQQGDSIYIFSDGYQDQFGGEKGKKLTKKGLKNILLSIHEKNMEAQYEALLNYHREWKGKEEQVDDICILGVKI